MAKVEPAGGAIAGEDRILGAERGEGSPGAAPESASRVS
jgi:hypothetical protein